MSIEDSIRNPQHHAYLIFGDMPSPLPAGMTRGVYVLRTEKAVGVDDVRVLREYADCLVGTDGRKVLCIAPGITVQAQNALLKVIEEVQRGVYFFLCFPAGTDILPTLISRCFLTDAEGASDSVTEQFAEFIAARSDARLRSIDKLWDQDGPLRHIAARRMVQDCERHLHRLLGETGDADAAHIRRCMRAVRTVRGGMYDGGLSRGTMHLLAFI